MIFVFLYIEDIFILNSCVPDSEGNAGGRKEPRAVGGGSLYCHRRQQETSPLLNLSCPNIAAPRSGKKNRTKLLMHGKGWQRRGKVAIIHGLTLNTPESFLSKQGIGKFAKILFPSKIENCQYDFCCCCCSLKGG